MTDQNEPKRIKTTETIFEVIEAIRKSESPTITSLTDRLEMSKSSVHTHLYTLRESGYLVEEDGVYRLGLPFLTLGGHVQQTGLHGKLYGISKSEIHDLAEETGERAQLVVEENGLGFHLCQSNGERAVQSDRFIGSRTPLHSTAAGKALLAHLPTDRVHEIIERHGLPADTDKTVTDVDRLFERLEQIRKRGYAFDRGERIRGIYCVGAPVMADGTIYGSVSVSIPKKRADEGYLEGQLPEAVTNTAQVISLNSKYS